MDSSTRDRLATAPARTGRTSNIRWIMCALLFFATVIAYVDRGVIGYLEPSLAQKFHWNSIQYGHITTAFQIAYAIGLVAAGWLTDRLGTRLGFALAIGLWSIAAMLPGAAWSVATFGVAMFILGLAEAANFPACIKTVAEWFPATERALSTGIFNSGAGIGSMVVPLAVPFLTYRFGWRVAFLATGASGFVWLAFWLWLYRKPEQHPRVSASELALIQSDPIPQTERLAWRRLFPVRETWAFCLGKFLTDPIWWFWLFWLPGYLQRRFSLTLDQNRAPVFTVYFISILGSIAAGWLPKLLIRRGHSHNFARKVTMLVCALAVVPVIYAPFAPSLWVVVGLIGLAAAAHQGWSANLFTLPSDVFPKNAVASVVGIGGMCGAIGGAILQFATGYILVWMHGSYMLLFAMACSAYLLALGVIQLFTPKLAPARLG